MRKILSLGFPLFFGLLTVLALISLIGQIVTEQCYRDYMLGFALLALVCGWGTWHAMSEWMDEFINNK